MNRIRRALPLIAWSCIVLACTLSACTKEEGDETNITGPGQPSILVQLSARSLGDGASIAFSATPYGGTAPYLFSLTTGDGGAYEIEGATLDVTHVFLGCGDIDGWPAHVTVTELASRATAADDARAYPCQGL